MDGLDCCGERRKGRGKREAEVVRGRFGGGVAVREGYKWKKEGVQVGSFFRGFIFETF